MNFPSSLSGNLPDDLFLDLFRYSGIELWKTGRKLSNRIRERLPGKEWPGFRVDWQTESWGGGVRFHVDHPVYPPQFTMPIAPDKRYPLHHIGVHSPASGYWRELRSRERVLSVGVSLHDEEIVVFTIDLNDTYGHLGRWSIRCLGIMLEINMKTGTFRYRGDPGFGRQHCAEALPLLRTMFLL